MIDHLRQNPELLYKIFCLATNSQPELKDYTVLRPVQFIIIQRFKDCKLVEYIRIEADLSINRFIAEGVKFKSAECENLGQIEGLIKCLK